MENHLIHEKIPKLLLQYVVPAIIAMIVSGMQTMIDGLFIGNVIGSIGMASVNIATPYMQVLIALSMVISIGSQSYIGLKLGNKQKKQAQDAFKTASWFILVIGGIISGFGILFSRQIAFFLGANSNLLPYVSIYIKMLAIFTLPTCFMFLYGFLTRLIQRPDCFLKGTILSLLCNILFNYLFISQWKWNLFGAGLATGLSYSVAFVVMVVPFLKKSCDLPILSGDFSFSILKRIVYNGSSEGINALASAISAYIFNISFLHFAGVSGVAAYTVIGYIVLFGTFIMFGIADGSGPIISYNFGNQQKQRLKQLLSAINKVIFICSMVLFLLIFFYGDDMISFFVKDDLQVIEIASVGSKLYAFVFFFNGFNIFYSSYFTSLGNAKYSALIAFSRGILWIGIGIVVLPFYLGLKGLWLLVPFAETMTFLLVIVLLIRNKKLIK